MKFKEECLKQYALPVCLCPAYSVRKRGDAKQAWFPHPIGTGFLLEDNQRVKLGAIKSSEAFN